MADYKATAGELASIANAIRLKGGTSLALEYPSGWITAIQNLVPASGGSEITPSDPTAEYKVTDTELTAVANAIRTRGGTSAQLEWPTGFVAAIQAIPTALKIVSWANGTDAEIADMIAALDAGTLTVAQTGWQIGDERVVSLSAMSATYVGESHVAQNATFVLMDSGHYDLVGVGKDHFVVGLKNCLAEPGEIHGSNDSAYWKTCGRRSWCNEVFRNSIPETLRSCFKQFICKVPPEYNSTTLEDLNEYFSLFAEKEILGSRTYSNSYEADALSQIEYYKTAANRNKSAPGTTGNSMYWERSQGPEYNKYCNIFSGNATYDYPRAAKGIAPFGCI